MWRNRLCFYLQVKYYLYSSSILVALNWIAEAENHPSPEECGGIDYASIYMYSIKYYLYSSSIPVALNWIAEAENHTSPEECGGIDYASIYK
jgi:hypothetical protein